MATWQEKFYTSQTWRKFRHALIAERGMRCEKCGRLLIHESDIEADHIQELTPATVYDGNSALNPANVQLLCKDCHNAKHRRYGHERQQVYIVYGSPCSGKSTYVREHMHRGDIVLDFDTLYSCLSGCQLYDKPQNVKAVIYEARDNIINSIKVRLGKWNTAYIIGTYPHKAQRESLAKQLNAQLILIDTDKDTCLANAMSRGVFADEYRKYVEQWFASYEP